MLKQDVYQLHDYKIIEQGGEPFQWERHADFGVQESGRCFIIGKILIIGKPRNEEVGLLIGEFQDQLRKSPPWSKTEYCCHESSIIGTVTKNPRDHVENRSINGPGPGRFRLGVYVIEVKTDGTIRWNSHLGNGRVGVGAAELGSGVLFLMEKTSETKQDRRRFQRELKSLPAWSLTGSYAPAGAVIPCTERFSQGSIERPEPWAVFVSPVKNSKSTIAGSAKVGRTPQPQKPEPEIGAVASRPRAPMETYDKLGFLRPKAESPWSRGTAFIRNYVAGGASKKDISPRPDRRSGWTWKAGLAGVLVATLAVGAFVVILFHHEIDGLNRIVHAGYHSRDHHHQRHMQDYKFDRD